MNFGRGARLCAPAVVSAPACPRAGVLLLVALALCAALLAGCSAAPAATNSAAAPVCPAPAPGATTATLCGQALGADTLWPDEPVTAFAAPFTRGSGADGFYILEPMIHPHAELLSGGYFILENVPAGEYILIIGIEPSDSRAVLAEDARPRVIAVPAGQTVDLGALEIR